VFFCQPSGSRRGPEREFWGGSVTVISIRLCVFCQRSGSRRGPGRELWGGSVTVISIQLCVFVCPVEAGEGQGGNNGEGV
jgi:ferredoxin